ncbi:MAG: hypothetical protein JNJ57_17350 [Saprospiraceae bacterium]|nr:hypothetical protein [Saprospiraceae bacterium]
MAKNKALYVLPGGLKVGAAQLGMHGETVGSIKTNVHDGDTVNVRLIRNLGVRFLGIDTPEVSLEFPGSGEFVSLKKPVWDELFTSGNWKTGMAMHDGLLAHLSQRIGDGTGVTQNHADLADLAQKSLEAIMEADLQKSQKTKETFELFMAFGHEFLDGYGRLLCYLNSARENFEDEALARAATRWSYNERQLMSGWSAPYFIWPNVQPFINQKPFDEKNATPSGFWNTIKGANKLQAARDAVAQARTQGIGIFDPSNPLKIMPFELRMISRKKGPDRYVINLADEDATYLLEPSLYYLIPNPEDRLYVPAEYVAVFRLYGWNVLGADAVAFLNEGKIKR